MRHEGEDEAIYLSKGQIARTPYSTIQRIFVGIFLRLCDVTWHDFDAAHADGTACVAHERSRGRGVRTSRLEGVLSDRQIPPKYCSQSNREECPPGQWGQRAR